MVASAGNALSPDVFEPKEREGRPPPLGEASGPTGTLARRRRTTPAPSACLSPPSCPPSLPFPLILPSRLRTSLPLPGGEVHPPHEVPGMVLTGEEAEAQTRHPAGPGLQEAAGPCRVPKPQLGSSWTLGPFRGLPACCLPSFPFCLCPGALFSCFPWRWPVGSPTRAHDHHASGPGRYCPLGRAPGRTCLMLLCGVRVGRGPSPWPACAPSSPPPPFFPFPSPAWPGPATPGPFGVIQLPLVSERIILSVDCPFL